MGTRRPPVVLAALFGVGLGMVAPLSVRPEEESGARPTMPVAVRIPAERPTGTERPARVTRPAAESAVPPAPPK